jgi:hypothetical protein
VVVEKNARITERFFDNRYIPVNLKQLCLKYGMFFDGRYKSGLHHFLSSLPNYRRYYNILVSERAGLPGTAIARPANPLDYSQKMEFPGG